MKYKAIMLDIDGTTVPYSLGPKPQSPSTKVTAALKRAQKHVSVSLVTARPYSLVKPLLQKLNLKGYSILLNGAQIINNHTFKTIWKTAISTKSCQSISAICNQLNLEAEGIAFGSKSRWRLNQARNKLPIIADIWIKQISSRKLKKLNDKLSGLHDISVHQMINQSTKNIEVDITDIHATKQHAIYYIAKLLKIKPKYMIGVGDGPNDYPLLMACGLKIAMGNAVPELKAIADFVVPPVEEDGVATIIEKFILNQ